MSENKWVCPVCGADLSKNGVGIRACVEAEFSGRVDEAGNIVGCLGTEGVGHKPVHFEAATCAECGHVLLSRDTSRLRWER